MRGKNLEGYGLFGLIASICIFLGWASLFFDAVISVAVFFLPDSLAAISSFFDAGPQWTALLKKIAERWVSWGAGGPGLFTLWYFVMGLWGAAQWFVLGYAIRLALDFRTLMRQQTDLLKGLGAAGPRQTGDPEFGL